MAHDYEDIHNIDSLEDRELRDLVREQLSQHSGLDIDQITVRASEGKVTLSGRVGTDGESRIAEHVLTDVLGIQDFTNDLVVDPIARGQSSEAADESVEEDAEGGSLLGHPIPNQSAEAAHLADGAQDDMSGTTDYERVMEDGMTWNPPDSPTPEGMLGTDAGPGERDGQH